MSATGLSAREIEVVARLAEGESNKAIARRLELSERTVQAHVAHAMAKVGASNRTHLVVKALRAELIPLHPDVPLRQMAD